MINYQTLETHEENVLNDEKLSSGSAPSLQSNDSNRVVLNPDGSLMNDTKRKSKKIRTSKVPIMASIDDDEVIFYGDANEIPSYFDDFVSLFIKNIRYFLLLLITFFLLETFCGIYAYFNQEEIIDKLQKFYPSVSRASLSKVFDWATIIEIVFSIVYYSVGLLAALRRSSRLLSFFTTLSIIGLIVEMLLAYINKFNLIVFLWRFAALVYSRFLSQLLISVLLIPRVTQGRMATNDNRPQASNDA